MCVGCTARVRYGALRLGLCAACHQKAYPKSAGVSEAVRKHNKLMAKLRGRKQVREWHRAKSHSAPEVYRQYRQTSYWTHREKRLAQKHVYNRRPDVRRRMLAYASAYRQIHLAHILARQAAYRAAHRDTIIARATAYRAAHRHEIAAKQRAYLEANREAVNARARERKRIKRDRKQQQSGSREGKQER